MHMKTIHMNRPVHSIIGQQTFSLKEALCWKDQAREFQICYDCLHSIEAFIERQTPARKVQGNAQAKAGQGPDD